jgi:spermidine/putrescine transport system substrate-binding protein
VQEKTTTLRPQIGGFFDYGGTFSSLNDGQMLAFCGIGDWITGALEKSGAKVRSVIPGTGRPAMVGMLLDRQGLAKADLAKKWIQYITSAKGQVKSARWPPIRPHPQQEGLGSAAGRNPAEAKRQGMTKDARAMRWT